MTSPPLSLHCPLWQLYRGDAVSVDRFPDTGSTRSLDTAFPAEVLIDILTKAKYTADLTQDEREKVCELCGVWKGVCVCGGGGGVSLPAQGGWAPHFFEKHGWPCTLP